MKLREFEDFVVGNARMPMTQENYLYSFVGLAGECGEVMEWLKKSKLRTSKTKLTEHDLKNELGDVLHYMVRIAAFHGWTIGDIAQANVDKLKERYGAA
jgi:NTP pyrophosphatase (non-canonical NTP hydrolase)